MKKLIILICIVMVAPAAYADSAAMEEKKEACGELSSYKQIYGCYSTLYNESDALLNKEYKELMDYLSGTDKDNLRDAQRKWIKYRDADCLFSDPRNPDVHQNVIAAANNAACLTIHTINRLKELEEYNSYRGCNGCPW